MPKWAAALLTGVVVLFTAASSSRADEEIYVPGVKIVLEVRTAQGHLRSFQRPGSPPTYWDQTFPVVQSDRVTIDAFIATGGAELGEVRIRLDNKLLSTQTSGPWRIETDTSKLALGHHLVEVWAATKEPNSRFRSVTTSFLVVPDNDPLLRVLQGETSEAKLPISDEERLACAIRSRDQKVDQETTTDAPAATVAAPVLFYVSAGPTAKEFFYTLTRDGKVTYTSPRLPLMTHILLEPQKSDGQGQPPGELILTTRVGDGTGRFGPPAWVTVRIKGEEAAK
jgi:hypothetical protein